MKTTELRIGNYINVNGYDKVCTGVLPKAIYYQNDDEYGERLIFFTEEIQPILLTEDWLLEFGFNDDEPYNTLTEKGFEFAWYQYKPSSFLLNGTEVSIEYVHHLQNLYFDLTGKKLLKPKP